MTLQIMALAIVVGSFSALLAWVYWPGNQRRFDAGSRLPFDDEPPAGDPRGERS